MLTLKNVFKEQLRHYICGNTRNQILKDAFGMNSDEASLLLSKIKLKDPDILLSAIKTCRNLGFSDEQILSDPKVLNRKPMLMEQEYLILQEGGFSQITPDILYQYRTLYSKKILELKLSNYVPNDTNVAESFSRYFDPQPDEGVIDFHQYTDDERWRDVHASVIRLYLGWRLQATKAEMEKLFRIHIFIRNKSIRLLCENIKLALQVGLSLKRIRTSGYVLHAYPPYTKDVLRDYSNIAGGNLMKAIKGCPKLLMVSPEKYAKIYGLLKKHNIRDEAIRNQLNVFQYAPQTVQYRLEEIDKLPELRVLKHHNKFLSLVVHHQRAKSRLCYLQELKMKCLPLKLLALKGRIDSDILSGIDLNDAKEIMIFLSGLLKCKSKLFEKQLKKHPHYCAVPLIQMEDTYNYLIEMKFTNDDICRVVSILLYPKDLIEENLASIKIDPILSKTTDPTDQLNLLLYNMEKKI